MSRTELAAERKLQIILATIECIASLGFVNISMQDVADKAKVSKGIIHYYFLNKEDLMMGVLSHVAGEIEGFLRSVETNPDASIRLSNLIWLCANVVQTKREYYRINIEFWTQIDQKEKVRQEIAAHYTKFRDAITAILDQGMTSGQFRQGDTNLMSSLIIALIDGISLQWLFDKNVFDFVQIVRACEDAVMRFIKT